MQKALFLDRDGVINVEKEYLYKIEDFEFIDGIFELCRCFLQKDFTIFVVTNQSGIARGYYSEEDFNTLTSWMLEEFQKRGIDIAKVYHCPHHPDISGECVCRKPHPGMLLQAKEEFCLDMKGSVLIGDKPRDIEAAYNAGVDETYLFGEFENTKTYKTAKVVQKLEDIWKEKC